MDYKAIINNILSKLNFLDNENKISLTNLTVIIFVTITAFRALFGGSMLTTTYFKWNIEPVDYSTALTVLFSLWNYDRKRQAINNQTSVDEKAN